MEKTTSDALEILDSLVGDDKELKEMIEEEMKKLKEQMGNSQ